MLAQHHEELAQNAPQTAPESSKEKGKLTPIILVKRTDDLPYPVQPK
jgi:hypothetical protein